MNFLGANGTVIDLMGKILTIPDHNLAVNVLSRGETTIRCNEPVTVPQKFVQ